MNYIVLCISYLICWRICFSPTYHLAGFTYTLYSAMFLSIGIKYKIIIVSLVMHLGTFSPTRLLSSILPGGLSRTRGISIIVFLVVYLLLSRTGGISIIVYLEVCLGLEVYLLLST